MTELSGFTAAQPIANLGPQALQLPTSLAEVCECTCDCGASRILKGLAQIVAKRLTHLIEINVQAVDTPERVRVAVIPWDKDGVAKNGVALPGGHVVIDGTRVVGMSPEQYAAWLGLPPSEPDPTPEPEPEPAPEQP